jgi:3-dehydroquinate synthetase
VIHKPNGGPASASNAGLDAAIWKDKKVENGKIHFVLIRRIGKVTIEDLDDLHKFTE